MLRKFVHPMRGLNSRCINKEENISATEHLRRVRLALALLPHLAEHFASNIRERDLNRTLLFVEKIQAYNLIAADVGSRRWLALRQAGVCPTLACTKSRVSS